MIRFLEKLTIAIVNRLRGRRSGARFHGGGLDLGARVVDDAVMRDHVTLSSQERMRHVVVLGKTGSGKSFFLRHMSEQDIDKDRGFLYFDLHGDATPWLLKVISARERREHRDLTNRVILIDPADPIISVGLNPLEQETTDFVRIADVAEILKRRWGLDSFGARTDELLRNTLYALSENQLTLVELVPFLTNATFRTACLRGVENPEVRQYFELRYGQASEAMQATMREPILNKTSAFTADPKFRHIVGQEHSTFSLRDAMDHGHWIIVNLAKGRLGVHALTLGSLMFTMVKNALFTRTTKSLFTVYCDEVQNFVSQASEIETILSEARKTGTGFVSANQFLDQLPPEMRAALFSAGTHVCFQLSSVDAGHVAVAIDGSKVLAERLKNLYQRHAIVKSGVSRYAEIRVPDVETPQIDPTDLLTRVRSTCGRARGLVERDIAKRHERFARKADEVLHGWR